MEKMVDLIGQELAKAFDQSGYDASYAKVTRSDRPDLCEYQCNGAMAGAKAYHKAPFMIAEDVIANLEKREWMEQVEVVAGLHQYPRKYG